MSINGMTIDWVAAILVAACAAALGHGQEHKSKHVPLKIRGDDNYYWIVNGTGDGFAAQKVRFGEDVHQSKNFREGADWMLVSGKYMGYDVEGKSPGLIACDTMVDASKWNKEGGLFGMRLQALKGPYKGWWVGLQPTTVDGKPSPKLANLVLVQDKKEAVQFRWEDPNDAGR
jgi:hypothetical protein